MTRATAVYPNTPDYIVALDVRVPGVTDRRYSELAWRDCGDIEALDEDDFVLIERLGSAWRRAA